MRLTYVFKTPVLHTFLDTYVKHALLNLYVYHASNVRLTWVFQNARFTDGEQFAVYAPLSPIFFITNIFSGNKFGRPGSCTFIISSHQQVPIGINFGLHVVCILYHQWVFGEQIRSVWQLYLIHFFITNRCSGNKFSRLTAVQCTLFIFLSPTGVRGTNSTCLTAAHNSFLCHPRYCGDTFGLSDICTLIFCSPQTGAPSRRTHMTYLTPAPLSPIPRILCVAKFDIVQWPSRRQDTPPNPSQSPNWRQEAARCHRLRHTSASPPRKMPHTQLY